MNDVLSHLFTLCFSWADIKACRLVCKIWNLIIKRASLSLDSSTKLYIRMFEIFPNIVSTGHGEVCSLYVPTLPLKLKRATIRVNQGADYEFIDLLLAAVQVMDSLTLYQQEQTIGFQGSFLVYDHSLIQITLIKQAMIKRYKFIDLHIGLNCLSRIPNLDNVRRLSIDVSGLSLTPIWIMTSLIKALRIGQISELMIKVDPLHEIYTLQDLYIHDLAKSYSLKWQQSADKRYYVITV